MEVGGNPWRCTRHMYNWKMGYLLQFEKNILGKYYYVFAYCYILSQASAINQCQRQNTELVFS